MLRCGGLQQPITLYVCIVVATCTHRKAGLELMGCSVHTHTHTESQSTHIHIHTYRESGDTHRTHVEVYMIA